MIRYRIKAIIVSLAMILVLFVENSNYFHVYAITNNDLTVPQEVTEYAKSIYKALSATVDNNENLYDISISNVDTLQLGEPYIIYDAANTDVEGSIFYFPIIDCNHIILELCVYTIGNEFLASVSEGLSKRLDEVGYLNSSGMVFFTYENSIYYETENEMDILVENYNDIEELDTDKRIEQNHFMSLNYKSKKLIIDNKKSYIKYGNIPDAIECAEETKGFSQNDTYGKRLNTKGCEVLQTANDCWAASVATTIRYVTGNMNVTCGDVSDAVDIERGTGGDIYDKQLGLALFGVYYSKMHFNQISFDSVKINITSQHPILISTYNQKAGHALTIVGYSTYGAVKQVTVWNSGNGKFQTVEYKINGTGFIYNNSNFVWKRTLCFK